ncbi:ABA4-like family protein [Qaidamihabitans albus]|uniref:ABA4-like family protein n=1 Tax=Qaidamihabitans albus TaxID=2795733 RepID=UPI0018F1B17F|nr:ABA4-like family protein [Qaidamihabitans albus]
MSAETLFGITFYLAVPFWALMILAPGWSWTRRIVSSPWIAAPPLAVYTVLALRELGRLWTVVSDPALGALRDLLGSPVGAAAIWAHLIAFDLFVGRWIYLDARERGVHHALLAPVLVLTILLSPFGLLAYLLVRAARRRTATPRLHGCE